MKNTYIKYLLEQNKKVLSNVMALPMKSHINMALQDILQNVKNKIEFENENDLEYAEYPPLYKFVESHSLRQLKDFDKCIDFVFNNSDNKEQTSITSNLRLNENRYREWFGWLFELYCKSVVVRKNRLNPNLKYINENGRNPDLKVEIKKRSFVIECTVSNFSQEDECEWDKYLKELKIDKNATLFQMRNPYRDKIRFYFKVFEKLAKNFNLNNTQLSFNFPNILLISLNLLNTSLNSSPAINWALDELFSEVRREPEKDENKLDSSLDGWMLKHSRKLISDKQLDENYFRNNHNEIFYATKRISAIYIFSRFSLVQSRINYNAHENHKICHGEAAVLDALFSKVPIWG
jgi:hypothetical protein